MGARGGLLQPERLRAGLGRYVKREREQVLRNDPEKEAKVWLEKNIGRVSLASTPEKA
jgi:hypothetical protein